ncbi:hypothetical protein ACE6H2_008254 [Prunus campanulata]
MHLWPSATIRDSSRLAYLRKVEWNLQRMKIEKESSASVNQKLLDSQEGGVQQSNSKKPDLEVEEPLADTILQLGNFAIPILLMLNEAIFSFYSLLAEIALLFFFFQEFWSWMGLRLGSGDQLVGYGVQPWRRGEKK